MKRIPDSEVLGNTFIREGTTIHYRKGRVLFAQGDSADAVFLLREGRIKLAAFSGSKETTIAILGPGDLIGECSLTHHTLRQATATALTNCAAVRMTKPAILRLLGDDHVFTRLVLSYVLARKARIEEDLVDQRSNTSEQRLARVLPCWRVPARTAAWPRSFRKSARKP